jgi:ribosomal protein S18 acetylase RimI-like enzyme
VSGRGFAIRPAVPADAAAIAALVDELRLQLADPAGHLTKERILEHGFGPEPEFCVLVAEREGALVGYALYLDAYEPAFAQRGVYLADLYVAEATRGLGVGRALVAAVGEAAVARGRTFVWWVAQKSNTSALAFYERLKPDFRNEVVAHAIVVGG